MRVGIAGAHRVGKTTLTTEVSRMLDITMLTGSATPSYEAYDAKPTDDLSFGHRLKIQNHILKSFMARSHQEPTFITDRTPLDYIAYTLAELSTATYKSLSSAEVKATRQYVRDCLNQMSQFDIVFIVPPGIPIEHDGSKALCDRMMIDRIHALIMEYAAQSNHQRVYVLDRQMTELYDRVHFVTDWVRELQMSKALSA